MPGSRSAALVVRVWLDDEAGTLRARLVAVGEPDGERTVAVADGTDAVVRAVRAWLEHLAAPPPPAAPPPAPPAARRPPV